MEDEKKITEQVEKVDDTEQDEEQVKSESRPNEEGHNPEVGTKDDEQDDMFPRSYVEELRKENATYRERAKESEGLAARLHAALVALDGRLADPADLPFDQAHLDDPDALKAAVAELVERKPGLKARQVTGDVGAGNRGASSGAPADLISLIRTM